MPTMADLLHIDLNGKTEVSGRSVASLIDPHYERNTSKKCTVFWRIRDRKAALKGNWKLVINDNNEELYNLFEDIGETRDVKKDNVEIFNELKSSLEVWENSLDEEEIISY